MSILNYKATYSYRTDLDILLSACACPITYHTLSVLCQTSPSSHASKIRDQKRKHRFEKDVLVNYMVRNGPPSEHVSYCRKWPNVSVPLTVHRQRWSKQSLERAIATDILSRKFFFIIVQKLLKQLARMQSGHE